MLLPKESTTNQCFWLISLLSTHSVYYKLCLLKSNLLIRSLTLYLLNYIWKTLLQWSEVSLIKLCVVWAIIMNCWVRTWGHIMSPSTWVLPPASCWSGHHGSNSFILVVDKSFQYEHGIASSISTLFRIPLHADSWCQVTLSMYLDDYRG